MPPAGLTLRAQFPTIGPYGGRGRLTVHSWRTYTDKTALFAQQTTPLKVAKGTNRNPTITVDEKQTFQAIDGFGFALTGGSAQHMIRMEPSQRSALIKELFATDGNN